MNMSSDLAKVMRIPMVAILATMLACVTAAPSLAKPILKLKTTAPEVMTGGETIKLVITVQNVGDEATTGPVTVTDTTDIGPISFTGEYGTSTYLYFPRTPPTCESVSLTLTCMVPPADWLPSGAVVTLSTEIPTSPGASGTHTNVITVSGGGMQGSEKIEHKVTFEAPGPFNFTLAAAKFSTVGLQPATQAGSAPADFTTSLRWRNFQSQIYEFFPVVAPVERFKDVIAHLPPGLIGNPSSTKALCTADELGEQVGEVGMPNCPLDSQVGVVSVYGGGETVFAGLFNMVAPYGVATELGFQVFGTNILLQAYVRPGDHGIDIVSRDTSTAAPVYGVDVTAWGDPSSPIHDRWRGLCIDSLGATGLECPTVVPRTAFLRNPTSCPGAPLQFGVESNSYEHLDTWASASFAGPTMTGCDLLPFSPSITVDPTGTASNSPTGVSVKLSMPQNQNPDGLAQADLKKAVVTLPEGMAINPSSADGLAVCDDAHLRLDSNTPADCPDGSKVGTVLLHTQLLSESIEGSIYLRPQNSSDPMSGEMFRMAIELRNDARGLDFKVAGQIQANPATGRLTTTFDNNPQLPFEDISLQFKSGARAPLVAPASCETQTTEASLYSWAQPDVPVHRSSSFQLTSGPNGGACPPPVPFNPSFSAGVSNVEAGSYTSFLTTFSRSDADQSMQHVSVKMPKGLLGSLIGLPLCPEAQANAGTCDQASQIGTTTAGAGAGPTPFYVTGGKVFITAPYEGAPYGLSVVVPAKAGPFDLGTVVVRARVDVDVHTAQLTVTTDPLPQVVGGVPVNLRLVNVTIDRPHFVYNPTNCEHTEVTGTMTGGQGAVAKLAKGFQVTNCGALRFEPKFTVSTSGKTSRANGASLEAKLVYPKNSVGKQVNIAKVKVSLPRQLPSRLTTLQKACTAETFEANPAACPGPSRIGTATATTPVLPVRLSGPVYFVSHGGEAFPDLVVVLQGYGLTVDIVGTTFISKSGITSTTFRAVPDVPVGTFELKLPTGQYSALAANGDLCKSKLVMPTLFVAQDGVRLQQATPIAVTGCKPSVTVLRHSVKGRTVTVTAKVPSAGRLVASGAGLSRSSVRLGNAGDATMTLVLSDAKRRLLSSHPGRRLKVTVKLLFTPNRGSRSSSALTVLMR
jgi:uncharacterized repeat protein (TIGR01451 family)